MPIKNDIGRLVPPPDKTPRLGAAKSPTALRAKTGVERKQSAKAQAGQEITVQSTDGLFTFTVQVVKT